MTTPRRGGNGGGHARRTLAALMPLAAVLIGAGCSGGDDLGGQAVARVTAGEMVEATSGNSWVGVHPGDEVPTGARVRTGEAEAHLALRSGEVWLGPQAAAVVTDDQVELLRGELLVASSGDVRTQWTEVEVTGEGVYRLTPGIAPRLRVYSGQVQVRRLAEVRAVPALREASLSARRLPASGQHLSYRTDDPWDQILLRDAIAFDNEAERLARGLARQYGTDPKPPEFYAGFALAPERTVPALANSDGQVGPPGEALMRLFMAQSAAGQHSPQVLERMVREVVEMRSAGARWGLVAAELGVTPQGLAKVVDAGQARYSAMLDQRPRQQAPPPGAPPGPPGAGSRDAGVPPPHQPQPQPPAPAPVTQLDSQPPAEPPPPAPAPAPQPEPDAVDAGDHPPQRQPNPTDLLGQQATKGLVASVVDLLLGRP